MNPDSDPLKCVVCEESFGAGKHCPRLLPCSHTFCSTCIDQLIIPPYTNRKCPVCRFPFEAASKEDITVNRAVLDVVDMLTKTSNFKILRQGQASSFEAWQETFTWDIQNGGLSLCAKEISNATKIMESKKDIKARFQRASEKIRKNILPALTKLNEKFEGCVEDIDDDYKYLEPKLGTIAQDEKELKVINSKIEACKNFASIDEFVASAVEIDQKLKILAEELKKFTSKGKCENSKMLKELEGAERKLALLEDILNNENSDKLHKRQGEQEKISGAIGLPTVNSQEQGISSHASSPPGISLQAPGFNMAPQFAVPASNLFGSVGQQLQ